MSQNAPTQTLDRYMEVIRERCTFANDKDKWDVYVLLNQLYMDAFDAGVARTKHTFDKEYSHDAAMAALPAILSAPVPESTPESVVDGAIKVGRLYARLALEPEVKP